MPDLPVLVIKHQQPADTLSEAKALTSALLAWRMRPMHSRLVPEEYKGMRDFHALVVHGFAIDMLIK